MTEFTRPIVNLIPPSHRVIASSNHHHINSLALKLTQSLPTPAPTHRSRSPSSASSSSRPCPPCPATAGAGSDYRARASIRACPWACWTSSRTEGGWTRMRVWGGRSRPCGCWRRRRRMRDSWIGEVTRNEERRERRGKSTLR